MVFQHHEQRQQGQRLGNPCAVEAYWKSQNKVIINRNLSSKILKIRVTTCKESKQTDVMPLQVQLHMDWGAVPSCRTGGQ